MEMVLVDVTDISPITFGTLAVLFDRERSSAGTCSCN